MSTAPLASVRAASATLVVAALAAFASLAAEAHADDPACYGVMFRTGGQTSGLGPWLFDVDPTTGAATNGRQLNVNIAVGIAINPATGAMYGLTDQLGRINNQSGTAGKNLIFTIDPANGFCAAVGQLDPTNTSSSAPLAVFEGDLEFHPKTGVLWGVSTRVDFARLFTVDLATGLGTIVADIQPGAGVQFDVSSIAFDASGQLWALDTRYPTQPGPARILRIDATTGAIEQTFQTSTTLGTVAGMVFHPATGELLVADGDFGGTANLYRFNAKSGVLELIGATGVAIGNSNGFAGLEFAPSAKKPCVGDLDGNGVVEGADLAALLGAWAGASAGADLDGDGTVGASDLSTLLNGWGACP